MPVKALITNKNLLKFLRHLINSCVELSDEKLAFLPQEIDETAADAIKNMVASCIRQISANIKGLQYALEFLNEKIHFHEHMTMNEVELIKEKREIDIAALKFQIEKTVQQLKLRSDKSIAQLIKMSEKKLGTLDKKRGKYIEKLHAIEQRKAIAQKKRIPSYTIERYDREINNIKKELRILSNTVDALKKEEEKSLRKIKDELQASITREEEKIKQLNDIYESKIDARKKYLNTIKSDAAAITKNFMDLLNELKQVDSALREQIAVNLQLFDTLMVCIPIYLVTYLKDNEERFSLFTPMTISEDISMIQGLRKILTLTSEPRLKSIVHPLSNELHGLLTESIFKKLNGDDIFRQNVYLLCRANNLLNQEDFEENLNNGLSEAAQNQWLTAEESATILKSLKEGQI
ncbi:MAG: hypothetical protein QXU99_00335 [Candidatus Bathyarchaeia archaeon]